jgi:hypothetical protein
MPRGYPSKDPPCGKALSDDELCALMAGHYETCKPQKAIDARNAVKRSRRRKLHEAHHPGVPWKGRDG